VIRRIYTAPGAVVLAATVMVCGPAAAIAQPGTLVRKTPVYQRSKAATSRPTGYVAALIPALSDASLATREAAQQSLLKLGPDIEPQLQWALAEEEAAAALSDRQNPSVQKFFARGVGLTRSQPEHVLPRYAFHQLSVLVDRFEEQRQASPSLITLHYTDAPLTDILRDFGRQIDTDISMGMESGYMDPQAKLLDWMAAARETINADRVNYWEALRMIVQGLTLQRLPSATGDAGRFLQVGFDKVYLGSSPHAPNIAWNQPGALVSGPMLIAASLAGSGAPTLTLRANAEPGLTGLNSNAMVRIEAVTDDLGHSLLPGDKRVFLPVSDDAREFIPSDGYRAWRVDIPLLALGPGRRLVTVRGEFGIGTGPPHQAIAISLPVPQGLPSGTQAKEIFVAEDCEILHPPDGGTPPYRFDPEVCRRENDHDTARRVDHILVLKNLNPAPVTFVVFEWLYGGRIDSVPQPDQVAGGAAVFRLHADPGESVHLHVGVRYDQGALGDNAIPAPNIGMAGEADFDGWEMTVKSVTRTGSMYSVSGELSLPIDAPAGPQGYHLFLSLVDEARWSIVDRNRSVRLRQEGDRAIEDWTVNSSEPGRIPAALIWDTPDATRWFTEPFEFHDVTVTGSDAR
jgi:hypothetical protein